MRDRAQPGGLEDEACESWRAFLEEQTDARLVSYLLTAQKLAEMIAPNGRARHACESAAVAMTTTLNRLAPETAADGLALFLEEAEEMVVTRVGSSRRDTAESATSSGASWAPRRL